MDKAIVTAFKTPPLSGENLSVQFDQGREIRFMRYVFMPKRDGIKSQWVRVTNISNYGMRIETQVPIAIRTPASYIKGNTYRMTIRDSGGKQVHAFEQAVNWNRMLQFTIDPKDFRSPIDIKIAPIEDSKP